MCKQGIVTGVWGQPVCNIKKRNVFEITFCVPTINGVIRIKNSMSL